MSPSYVEEHKPYFFNQRRDRQFQRRERKTLDDVVSTFGDKREGLRGDGESVVSAGWTRAKSALRRGSAASSRRVALSRKVSILPHLDKDGPKLVSAEEVQTSDTKSPSIESKQNEEGGRSGWTKVKETYKFNELKFGSTSILSNLAKCLESNQLREQPVEISEKLDPELLRKFLQDHQLLISDTVVEKREWQTDCYLDLSGKNKHPFLTAPPGISEEEGISVDPSRVEEERRKSGQVIAAISKQYNQQFKKPKSTITPFFNSTHTEKEKRPLKRVTLNQEVMSRLESPSRRPQTAHSILSNMSCPSDYSRPSSAGGESRITESHFDMLPAELRPSIMLYRRESTAPKINVKTPKTRLEKYKDQQKPRGGRHVRIKRAATKHELLDPIPKPIALARRPSTAQSPTARLTRSMSISQAHTAPVTINFSLTDSDTHNKGWLVHPTESQDPEMATLRIWDKKTKERIRKREEEKLLAKQNSADGPIVVKFYSDPQTRSLRSKHQRSATYPLPAVLSKLPTSVANFTTPGVASGDVMMIGEGPELAVLVHPDGSGHANYHSMYGQRQAITQSRLDTDTKSLYTIVYDDTEAHLVLACFSPLGRGWCYYPGTGTLRMYYNTTELRLYSEDGHVTRKFLWSSDKVFVSLQMNPCLSFHCTSMTNMVLRFSCRGQSYKFHVSSPSSLVAAQESKSEGNDMVLQSGLEFISDAAREYTKKDTSSPPLKPKQKFNKTHTRNQSLKDEVGPSQSVSLVAVGGGDEEQYRTSHILEKTLTHYRDRVKNTVDEWMSHYRQVIGISVPAHLRNSLTRSGSPSPAQSRSGSTRQLHSSRSYAGEVVHSRPVSQATYYHTHPLPSRVTSPLGDHRSSQHSPEDVDRATGDRTTPPPATPFSVAPTSLMNCNQTVPNEKLQLQRLKVMRKTRKRSTSVPTNNKSCSCPVALHNLLLKNLATTSPCRCDKRHPPYICDLEYDTFIRNHVPSTQVVVVCILSSLMEGSCPCEPMLNSLHYNFNRRRFSPCTQSSGDSFRVLKYDISHCLSGTIRTTPLLIERHRVWLGMFLMYVGGKLVHADSVFNGYGTTKKDFLKQVERCTQDALKGHCLPSDYRFTASTGGKHPSSSAWAYPLTGVLGFLVPFSPSVSHCSSTHQTMMMVDDHDDEDMNQQFDKSGLLLKSELNLSQSQTLSQLS